MWPILCLWLSAHCCPTDYPRYTTNNCWRSIDAHCRDGAGSLLFSPFPIGAANTLFMTICNLLAWRLPNIHDQQSLTLHWHTFSRWGREGITVCLAYEGGQEFVYDSLQPSGGAITHDAGPKLIDALLTLILIYCIVNLGCHRYLCKYIFGLNRFLSIRLRLNSVLKPSPVIFMHRPHWFYQNWYIALNVIFRQL